MIVNQFINIFYLVRKAMRKATLKILPPIIHPMTTTTTARTSQATSRPAVRVRAARRGQLRPTRRRRSQSANKLRLSTRWRRSRVSDSELTFKNGGKNFYRHFKFLFFCNPISVTLCNILAWFKTVIFFRF